MNPSDSPMTTTSKAVSMNAAVLGPDGPTVMRIPVPAPAADEVLVQVRAAAMNHADLAIAEGRMHGAHGGPGTVLGLEFAGDIVEVGSAVPGLSIGQRVMASGRGAFAEYAVAKAARVIPIPSPATGYQQAACLPVALQTMHDAIVTRGRLRAGDVVLVQGASSAVGLIALQMCRLLGARMIIGTSTNPERRRRLREFGADLVLDSSVADWPQAVLDQTQGHGADLIIDMVSGPVMNQNLRAAALEGRIVNVGRLGGRQAQFDFDLHALRRIEYVGVTFRTRTDAEVAEVVRRMRKDLDAALDAGRLSLPVDRVYPLEQVGVAFERNRARQHFGKLILVPDVATTNAAPGQAG